MTLVNASLEPILQAIKDMRKHKDSLEAYTPLEVAYTSRCGDKIEVEYGGGYRHQTPIRCWYNKDLSDSQIVEQIQEFLSERQI